MKKKWIYIAVTALVVGGAVATAVAHKDGSGSHGPWAMMNELGLSDEQKSEFKALRAEQREAMEALRDGDEKPDHEAMQAVFAKHRKAMAAILTPEQREKMEAMHGKGGMHGKGHHGKGGMHGGKGHHGEMGGPGRGGHALAMLDLSDEQKEQIKKLRKKQHEKMKEMRKKHHEAVEKVLTKEQRAKLAELKDEAFYGRGKHGGHGW